MPQRGNNGLMDDIVKQAIAKWPNVPDCYGWLGLDARGNWFMRDDRVQALGPFPTLAAPGAPGARGSRLQHEKLIDFIQRNCDCDAAGQWFFQNGPQRVYVELEATPFIWRVQADARGDVAVTAHTGQPAPPQRCLLDEQGRVYLETPLGFGLVHTQDVAACAEAVEQGIWTPEPVTSGDLPALFGYRQSPQAAYQVRI